MKSCMQLLLSKSSSNDVKVLVQVVHAHMSDDNGLIFAVILDTLFFFVEQVSGYVCPVMRHKRDIRWFGH